MGQVTKNERKKLDDQLKWLEWCVVLSGFAVAVGVAIEIGPKLLKEQIDSEVIGGAIVILGVAAEVILTFIAAQKTSRVQQLADADVAAANERAAVADLARTELEERLLRSLGPRKLTEQQRNGVRAELQTTFSGTSIPVLVMTTLDADEASESLDFAFQLAEILSGPGLPQRVYTFSFHEAGLGELTDLLIRLPLPTPAPASNTGYALMALLKSEGLLVRYSIGFPLDTAMWCNEKGKPGTMVLTTKEMSNSVCLVVAKRSRPILRLDV